MSDSDSTYSNQFIASPASTGRDAKNSVEYSNAVGFFVNATRLRTMRYTAVQRRKSVPSIEQLLDILKSMGSMACPQCSQQMAWTRRENSRTVITLQHDASGEMKLLCHSCNVKHGLLPGDTFYDVPPGHKYCHGCKAIKTVEEFCRDNSGRPSGRASRCKQCKVKKNREWQTKNSEKLKARELIRTERRRLARIEAREL